MKKEYLSFVILLITTFGFSQRYKVLKGSLESLKGISEYNITFDYSAVEVHGYESEGAFLKEKMDKRKNKEGKAEEFKKEWFESRTTKYEPNFINYFNERFTNNEIELVINSESKYTMNLKTTWIYPGYFSEDAKISVVINVFETANPKNIIAKIKFNRVRGIDKEQFNINLSNRIANAYEKVAKNLAMQLKRFL